jgi:hypothetical protein
MRCAMKMFRKLSEDKHFRRVPQRRTVGAFSVHKTFNRKGYAFQVQALGIQGLSAWSDSSTIMCV